MKLSACIVQPQITESSTPTLIHNVKTAAKNLLEKESKHVVNILYAQQIITCINNY